MIDQLVLYDPLSNNTMGETAENVAEQYRINREDQDAFALSSQQKTKRALEAGVFTDEIVPVPIPQRKGDPVMFAIDEHPGPRPRPMTWPSSGRCSKRTARSRPATPAA